MIAERSHSSVVIVGAGLAGTGVAQQLRALGHSGPVLVLGAEAHAPYDRPPLSKQVLAGAWEVDQAELLRSTDPETIGFELRTDVTVAQVQPQVVVLADGTQIAADQVVVATGVRPRIPVGFETGSRVHVLRTVEDAARLCPVVQDTAQSLLILGGGFIGTEIAATARTLGTKVTMVEAEDALLARVLPAEVSAVITRMHVDSGVATHLSSPAKGIVQDESGVQVTLADGSILAAGHAVVGFGTCIDTEPIAALGDVRNGIRCSSKGEVEGVDGVFGVGDVSAWWDPALGRHVRREHWSSATNQAITVAHTILGLEVPPLVADALPYFWSDQYGVKVQVLGWPDAADHGAWIQQSPDDGFIYELSAGGRLVGVVTIGSPRLLAAYRSQLERPER